MPFLGQDWRSPGDTWVRTNEGWEKLRLWRVRVFENLNENVVARLIRLALSDCTGHKDWLERRQPYIFYSKGNSKERKELTSLSEALVRLDMAGAVKDIRRINYVCKLLQLVITHKLASLSGTAQKHVFHILEALCEQVLKTEYNVGEMRKLLCVAEAAIKEGYHHHIGSRCLWSRHAQALAAMKNKLQVFSITEREHDGKVTFTDLPDDCIRRILYELADHMDVIHAGRTSSSIHHMTSDQHLWRQLCFFHFSNQQLLTFLPQSLENQVDWQYIYRRCYKRFGRRDSFADTLSLCSSCNSIFWKSLGHPCVCKKEAKAQDLGPDAFLNLFAL